MKTAQHAASAPSYAKGKDSEDKKNSKYFKSIQEKTL